MYTNQNNYLQYSCFLSSCQTRNWFFFQFYSFWLIIFKYPYCNRIVIVKVITITGCFAMYLITITIYCNHKNQRLQITFRLLKTCTCNQLHVITITDYNYNRSAYNIFTLQYLKYLTLKAPSKICSRRHSKLFLLFFRGNKSWHFMWIVCQTIHMKCQDLFSLKNKKK